MSTNKHPRRERMRHSIRDSEARLAKTTMRVTVEWIPPEAGGRKTGPPTGPTYMAPTIIGVNGWTVEWTVVLTFLGSTSLADAELLVKDDAPPLPEEFDLREGARCVAHCKAQSL